MLSAVFTSARCENNGLGRRAGGREIYAAGAGRLSQLEQPTISCLQSGRGVSGEGASKTRKRRAPMSGKQESIAESWTTCQGGNELELGAVESARSPGTPRGELGCTAERAGLGRAREVWGEWES